MREEPGIPPDRLRFGNHDERGLAMKRIDEDVEFAAFGGNAWDTQDCRSKFSQPTVSEGLSWG